MKIFTFLLFIISCTYSNSQEISVSATKLNIAYIGIDNPLTIMIEGKKCKDVKAITNNGSLTKISDCNFIFRPIKQGISSMKIYNNSKFIKEYKFRVKRIPDPILTLGGKLQGGAITKETLAAQVGLIAILKDFQFDYRISIKEFIIVICSENYYYSEQTTGAMLTSGMKEAIRKIEGNGFVLFTNVKTFSPDGNTRRLEDLAYTLIGKNQSEKCEENYYLPSVRVSEEHNTTQIEFNCPCNKKMLLIQDDKTTIKGINNDYFDSYKNVDNIKSQTKTTYYENGNSKSKLFIKYKSALVNCPFSNNKNEFNGLFKDQYLEWNEKGVLKIQGSYGLKEIVNEIDYSKEKSLSCGSLWNCNYLKVAKQGEWKYYNSDGKLIKIEFYNLGDLIKTTFQKKSVPKDDLPPFPKLVK